MPIALTPSVSEQRMARLNAARRWLRSRGYNSKHAGYVIQTPIPRYTVSGARRAYLSVDQAIAFAIELGWAGQ